MRNRKILLLAAVLSMFVLLMATQSFAAVSLTAPTATLKAGETVVVQGRVNRGKLAFSWYGDLALVPDPTNKVGIQALLQEAETRGTVVVIHGSAQGWNPGVSGRISVTRVEFDAVPDQLIRLVGMISVVGARYDLTDARYGTIHLTATDLALQEGLSRAAAAKQPISVMGAPQRWTSLKEAVVKQVGTEGDRTYDPRLSLYGQVEVIADGYQLNTPEGKHWKLITADPWFRATLARAAAEQSGLDVWGRYQENGNDLEVIQLAFSGRSYVGQVPTTNAARTSNATSTGSSQAARPSPAPQTVTAPGSVTAPRASQESPRQEPGKVSPQGGSAQMSPVPAPSTGTGALLLTFLGTVGAGISLAFVIWLIRRSSSPVQIRQRWSKRGPYRRTLDGAPQEPQKAMNGGERILYDRLEQVVAGRSVLIAPKMRLADVVNVSNLGLDARTRRYAFMAHLDFVLVDRHTQAPLCGVELDGRQHASDPETMRAGPHEGRSLRGCFTATHSSPFRGVAHAGAGSEAPTRCTRNLTHQSPRRTNALGPLTPT